MKFSTKVACGATLLSTTASLAAQTSEEGNQGLEEVVVTAQKRDQSLQEVGLSVTALGAEQLRALGITSAQQISESVAGVQVYNYTGSQPTFVIRAIGVQDFAPNIAPAAALYLDEVYLGSNILSGFQVFDTERIEILKGPQGDLFGRNTTGGAVSYTTKRPSAQAEGYVEATGANYETTSLDAAAGGALTDTLNIRVAGRYNKQAEGYYTNAWSPAATTLPSSPTFHDPKRRPGESEDWAGRVLLQWRPSERSTVLLNLHSGEKNADLMPLTPIGFSSIAGAAQPCGATALGGNYDSRYCGDVFGYTDLDGDPYRVNVDFVGRNHHTNDGASLRGEFDLGDLQLTSITAYDEAHKLSFTDTDGAPHHEMNQLRDTQLTQYTQELRLSSDANQRFFWIGGLYAGQENIDLRFYGTLSPLLGFTNFADPALASRVANQLELNFSQDTTTAAAYGHAEWRMRDDVTLVVGARYSYERKDFFSRSEFRYGDGLTPTRALVNFGASPADAALIDDTVSFDSFSGKLGVNYFVADDVLLYASVSRGFKSGGFDGDFAFTRAQLEPFKEETLTAYEVGWKATLADGTVFLNGAAFYYDFRDPQVRVAQVDPVTHLPFNQLINLQQARVLGGELDLSWRPLRGLDLHAGLALNDSKIDDDRQAVFDDNELPLGARISATLSARYQWSLSSALDLALQVDGKHNGSFYLNPENTTYLRQDPYTLLNARLSLHADDRWEIALWGRNLTEENFAVQSFALFGAYPVGYSPPRTYGVSFRLSW